MKFKKIRSFFLYLMPAALFLSYHPVLHLGETATMHLELSIAEIWLVLFAGVNLLDFKHLFRRLKKLRAKTLILTTLFILYFAITLIWTANTMRGLLTFLMLLLIAFDLACAVDLIAAEKKPKALMRKLQKALLLSAAAVSLFCWAQCFLDLAGVSREADLLCLGCTYRSFGFPHPNGFAIEPQFMGNLLLAPAILSVWHLMRGKILFFKDRRGRAVQVLLPLFLSGTLFLTFSRGAIYAFIIGLVILFNFGAKSEKMKPPALLKSGGVILATFIITLLSQGLMAAASPTNDTFISGVTKSVHQLTLGKVDLRPEEFKGEAEEFSTGFSTGEDLSTTEDLTGSAGSEEGRDEAYEDGKVNSDGSEENGARAAAASSFSGYVAESTNTRTKLTTLALDLWNDSPRNILFGTGLGSAGTVLYEKFPEELGSAKEIVQNQYASLLLETGLTGCALTLTAVIYILYILNRKGALLKKQIPLMALLAALAITLFFFSGLPNALHIYLFPVLLSQPPVRRAGRHQKD